MNKVKIQPSAHACPSVKGAAICMLKGLFSTWEARERRKKKPPRNLLGNAVRRAGCLLFQQAEVAHVEWLWQRGLLASQPYTINCPSGNELGNSVPSGRGLRLEVLKGVTRWIPNSSIFTFEPSSWKLETSLCTSPPTQLQSFHPINHSHEQF